MAHPSNASTTSTPAQAPAGALETAPDLSATRIDAKDPAFAPLLADLQGDILKPNGRNFAAYVVFSFSSTPGRVKPWLKGLAARHVTSAARQLDEVAAHRANGADAGTFGTMGLTAPAYEWLGYDIPHIPRDRQARFIAGMSDAATQALLNDPPPQCLDPWAREPIHAILNLFDDSQQRLSDVVAEVSASAAGIARVLTVQSGYRKREGNYSVEPFGFADGISQPMFYEPQLYNVTMPDPVPAGTYDPFAPLSLVLLPDPNGSHIYSCGSFMVYRKLMQDVAGFEKDVGTLASTLNIGADLAGAYVMGRFHDGTPVVESSHPTGAAWADNDFQYAIDPDGAKCPFQAHVRKANPRGDTVRSNGAPLAVERSHRIVRRAFRIQDTGEGTGLHFFCYQGDIGNQFELIQSSWSNQAHFNRMTTGLDGVIGQAPPNPDCSRPATTSIPQSWPKAWGRPDAGTAPSDFGRWVELKGGGYFFAPSLSFFSGLSA